MELKIKIIDSSSNFLEKYEEQISKITIDNIFGSPYFLNYHTKVNCSYLAIEKSKKLISYFPYSNNKKNFFSHQGATYGGFIQFENIDHDETEFIYYSIIEYLKKVNINKITIRFLPELFTEESKNSLNKFFVKHMDSLFVEDEYYLKLDKNIESINNSTFRRNHIRDIKSFLACDFEVVENNRVENIKIFYEILKENLKKHKTTPTHSLIELQWLLKNLNNNFKLTLVKNSNSYLAGIVKISINASTDYIIYGSINYDYNLKGALKYLYWHTAKDSYLSGKKYLTFGINNKHFEEKNLHLDNFKLGFGCEVLKRGTFELIL